MALRVNLSAASSRSSSAASVALWRVPATVGETITLRHLAVAEIEENT
jgi:hypothetical protein